MISLTINTCFALAILNFYLVNGHPKSNVIYFQDAEEKPYTFYTREDWGAVPPKDVEPIQTPVPYVIIHHTALPTACNTTAQCMAAMRSMQNYHNSMEWGDIGYHFCIGSEGGVYEGRGWYTVGIHAGPANRVSIGICLIGDWRVEKPPSKMLEATQALIATGVRNGALSVDYKLKGHNQIMITDCPGNALFSIISKWDHFTDGKGINE